MARPGRYLFQRKGSQNWHLRLQYPTARIRSAAASLLGREVPKKIEKSLHTADRREAEVLAGPEILEHKRFLLAVSHMMNPGRKRRYSHDDQAVIDAAYSMKSRQKMVPQFEQLHPPGEIIRSDDGSLIVPTADELIFFDAQGKQTKKEPNHKLKTIAVELTDKPPAEFWRAKTVRGPDVDHEIVENWIEERAPAKTHANAARNMLTLFRELHPGKTFATADRDDARAMVAKLEELGNVSATIKSKLSGLVAAVNLEMSRKKPRVKFNAFSAVASKKAEDTTKRMSLTEADVKAIEARRDLFTDEQWLMWKWCVNTGMRPAEVYKTKEEFREQLDHHPITGEPSDIRYVWVDRSKNLASTRKIAIPSDVLPLIPKEIKGPMFTETLAELCRLINVAMRTVGVTSIDPDTQGERKPFYSTRHRVKDRLENAGCPETLAKAIMGHSKGVHGTYGDGQPLWKLKPWIEYLNHTHKMPPSVTQALRIT